LIILPTHQITECLTARNDRVFLISFVQRVGATALIAAIEWYWYPPSSERNRLFEVYGTEWHGMHWLITAFPSGRLPAVRRLAKQLGLRITDGSPVMIGETGAINIQSSSRPSHLAEFTVQDLPMEFFPGTMLSDGRENLAVFTIENDSGSPVYKNRQRDEQAMFQASGEVSKMLNRGIKLTPRQIADYIYGAGSFPG
jgi:hypothetical protein